MMKPWVVFSAAVFLVALPALAQNQTGLRGAQSAAPTGSSAQAPATAKGQAPAPPPVDGALPPPPLTAAPAGPPPLMSPVDQAAAQCSAACSRDYYFCLAGDNADLCATTWSRCRATCDITARRTAR